ncbi:hypothetical protein FRB99_000436 [Tulasnella sp. 403]|nr:hypothetical protein FRB99_000436 [Tulasnella sp. 403]
MNKRPQPIPGVEQYDGTKLLPEEEIWAGRFEFLKSCGYLLRPRYRPGWVASWIKEPGLLRIDAEDGVLAGGDITLDAMRISDGETVFLKRVPTTSPEVEVGRFLSSDELKNDRRNHSAPVLEVLEDKGDPEHVILVLPMLRPVDMPPPASIGELVDFVHQTLEALFSQPDGQPLKVEEPSRTAVGGVRYYFVDFGISTRDQDKVVGVDGQERAPELSSDIPYDPYKLDVYGLGRAYKTLLEDRDIEARFLDPLIELMTKKSPGDRPSAAEAFQMFKTLSREMSWMTLSRRLRSESPGSLLARTFRDIRYRMCELWWALKPKRPLPPLA